MSVVESAERLVALVDDLRRLPAETEWVEFKLNNTDPERIGRTASALANGARLADKAYGYMVWGISNSTQIVAGTAFELNQANKGSEALPLWLAKALSPSPAFRFVPVYHPQGRVVLLEIPAANSVPIKFQHIAYIRIGDTTPKLSEFPQREEALLARLRPFMWERGIALSFITGEDVTELLDHSAYFALTDQREPETRTGILGRLVEDRLIQQDVGGRWNILNLGAILFARQLDRFETVSRKAMRVIRYQGLTRRTTERRQDGNRGYAAGFDGLLKFVDGLLPASENIATFRQEHRVYPAIAVRELVANALIHQDMTITGTGPMVEVFDDRIEITNPGVPITDMVRRLFGARPQSRNEKLADLMRKMHICEEQGTGLVKIISSAEEAKLPAPDFQAIDASTRAILFGPKTFASMERMDRVRICFQHTALLYQEGRRMTNTSLRDRFGIDERNAAQVSRVIRDCLEAKLIRVADRDRPKGGYVPDWA